MTKIPTRSFRAIVDEALEQFEQDLELVLTYNTLERQQTSKKTAHTLAIQAILQAVRQFIEDEMPEKMDLEVPLGFPTDPLMVADQAYNSALDEYRSKLLAALDDREY